MRTTEKTAKGSLRILPEREKAMLMNDVRDIYSDVETLFVASVVSDAMRRGVRHFKRDGTPLDRLSQVIDVLVAEGEVLMDTALSRDDPRH